MPLLGCSLLDNMVDRENNSKFYQKFCSKHSTCTCRDLQTHVAPGKTTALLNFDEF